MKHKSSAVKTVVAGVTGAIVAGAAVVAAVVLSDKKNQQKVKDALGNANGKMWDMATDIKEKISGKKG